LVLEQVGHHLTPNFFLRLSGGSRQAGVGHLDGLHLAFSASSHAHAFPAFWCVVGSAGEKRRTVTSCHDSKTPGRNRRDIQKRQFAGGSLGSGICPSARPPGACGRRPRPAHSWPGRRARRAPWRAAGCALAGLGAPRAGGGAWPGRRLPVIGLLCCNFPQPFGEPRCPRARPARPLPRESLCPRADRTLETLRRRRARKTWPHWGSLAVASPKEGGSVRAIPDRPGPVSACAAATGKRADGHPGSGRRQATPGPWPPDKGVLEVVAKLTWAFPNRDR
jgi:hypothetical protein